MTEFVETYFNLILFVALPVLMIAAYWLANKFSRLDPVFAALALCFVVLIVLGILIPK